MEETKQARLRTDYEDALARNQDAKNRLKTLLNRGQELPRSHVVETSCKQQRLTSQLDRLRLQKRLDKLQTLSHHYEQAEQLAAQEKIHDQVDVSASSIDSLNNAESDRNLAVARSRVDNLADAAQRLTHELELALVKARQQLKHEQALVQHLKNIQPAEQNSDMDCIDLASKLAALESTRNELQIWIENSLAKCELDSEVPNSLSLPDLDMITPLTAEAASSVEDEYEKYIGTRKRFIEAVQNLKNPVAAEPTVEAGTGKAAFAIKKLEPRPPHPAHLRHDSSISIKKVDISQGPVLGEIQSQTLPEYYHEKILNTYMMHLVDQTQIQDARLLHVLGLLSHESHLLPAYSRPSCTATDDKWTAENHQQKEVNELLLGWAAASRSADSVLRDSIAVQCGKSKSALSKAAHSLEQMQIMDDLRQKVLDPP